jgi:hypothetical protein
MATRSAGAKAVEIVERAAQIRPLLAGLGPDIQGGILADLVAMWLAGHQPADYREAELSLWLETVRALIPVNERMILEQLEK